MDAALKTGSKKSEKKPRDQNLWISMKRHSKKRRRTKKKREVQEVEKE